MIFFDFSLNFISLIFFLQDQLQPSPWDTALSPFQKLILINPMAQAIQAARYAAITHQTITAHSIFQGGWYQLIPFIIVAVVLVGGLAYFRKESKYFAENI